RMGHAESTGHGSAQRWHFRAILVGFGVVVVGLLVFVLAYFEPQKLFINKTVNEPLPAAASGASVGRPLVLAAGRFRSGEHSTTGLAQVLRLADGRRFVRVSSFRTSNGPVVH